MTQNVIDLTLFPKRPKIQAASPFRYPGGKGFLSSFLAHELEKRFNIIPDYAEPFCGGAGTALNLLIDGKVNNIYLNDADCLVPGFDGLD